MPTIVCSCGHKVEGKNPYETEAKAWHHAIKDHLGMLKDMTAEQIEAVIRNSHQQMKVK